MSRACKFSSDNRSDFLVASGTQHNYVIHYNNTITPLTVYSPVSLNFAYRKPHRITMYIDQVQDFFTIFMTIGDDPRGSAVLWCGIALWSSSSILRNTSSCTSSGSFFDDRNLTTPTLLMLPQQRGNLDQTLEIIVL